MKRQWPSKGTIEVRGHHLLCLLGFQGLGYSEEFTQNMNNILATAFSANTLLKIVDRCDAICAPCPHRKGSECGKKKDSAEKTRKQDQRIAMRLGIKIGDRMPSREIWARVKEKLAPRDLPQLCGECEWLDYCLKRQGFKDLLALATIKCDNE
ncbi:DUF1284 domain-containing protein [Dehalococcoidia bacterium]|nr:DUF1284 domain-containing protein [Dehalococcoidia bacterium]